MKYKKLFVFGGVVAIVAVVVGVCLTISYQSKVKFSKQFIKDIGGEALLKEECMKANSGPHHMDDGKVYERLLTVNDIRRIPKLCDCMIEESYTMIIKKEAMFKQMQEHKNVAELPSEMKQTLRQIFLVNYDVCEAKVIEKLEKRYKTIDWH